MVPRMRGKNEDKANDNKGRGTVKSTNKKVAALMKEKEDSVATASQAREKAKGKMQLSYSKNRDDEYTGQEDDAVEDAKKSSKGPRVRVAEKERVERCV